MKEKAGDTYDDKPVEFTDEFLAYCTANGKSPTEELREFFVVTDPLTSPFAHFLRRADGDKLDLYKWTEVKLP